MRDRTADLLRARQALSQLSYSPILVFFLRLGRLKGRVHQYTTKNLTQYKEKLVGLSGLEPPTSRLSGERSNQLSYRPNFSQNSTSAISQNTLFTF